MYEDPEDVPAEGATDPKERAREKADEFRVHAELAAVFEGIRKFDARLLTRFDPAVARQVQRQIGTLEKSRAANSPVLPNSVYAEASAVLSLPVTAALSTNDYHVHRRPGEVMIVRWLAGAEVEQFYTRLQAHFDAALNAFKMDERQANEWKNDPAADAYLTALDAVDITMTDRYLREPIRSHGWFVLSTQVADEMNIAYLCDYIMNVPAAEVVGPASAPPDDPSDSDLTWFFKRFSLRAVVDGEERMCFFTFLQKTDDDSFDF